MSGFGAGTDDAHFLINETGEHLVDLEIGDRTAGDAADYRNNDLAIVTIDGRRHLAHKDGTPY